MQKRMIAWEVETWHEGDTERKKTRGMAFSDSEHKKVRQLLSAAIRRTDKIEGLYAVGRIVELDESEATK